MSRQGGTCISARVVNTEPGASGSHNDDGGGTTENIAETNAHAHAEWYLASSAVLWMYAMPVEAIRWDSTDDQLVTPW